MSTIPARIRSFTRFSLQALLVLALTCLAPDVARAQTPAGVRAKVVPAGQTPATASHQPILVLPASGPASATLVAQPFNFTPTSYAWTAVAPADVKTQHIHAAKTPVTLSSGSGAQITATFPERGVYEILLSATNGAATATHQVWIQVWDRFDGLNPLQQVGRNPGLLPPASVRQLSPDPGPFNHPRLLFTDADWPELNAKTTASTEVAAALTNLQSALNNNFDKTTATVGPLRAYANALAAWANGGFLDATYTASVEPVRVFNGRNHLGNDPNNHLSDALVVASYLVWVRNNPALPQSSVSTADQARFRFLAQVAAAAGRAELTRVRLGLATSATDSPDMAVPYDLLYDWMTEAQRTDLRDYLFTTGYGYYNNGGGGVGRQTSNPSYLANGDFPNLVDPYILTALVIEGEEGAVTPAIVASIPVAPAATGPAAWPSASPASVWNLYRSIRWYSDYFVTPWGSPLNHHAYFEASSGLSTPALLALARRGQNAFVTSHIYQASFHAFNNFNPESPTTPPVLWDHHDSMGFGNGIGGYAGRYIARYMYPDDALMDSVYPIYRREVTVDFYTALFHVDRPAKTFAQVAAAKGMELTRFDPFRGAAVTRNSWSENDLSLYFECRPDVEGHMHAEANNFSLYALGRPWSTPPGYHITINDAAATVLIQDPALASDPATQGYYGESSSAATITSTRSQFPTPPAKFLEATDDPAGRWTLFAGDASSAYNYAYESGAPNQDTGKRINDFYYGEVLSHMYEDYDPSTDNTTLKVGNLSYNPVAYAYRTIFTARGSHPYVLVVDDISVDGVTPRNYRWNMPAFGRNAVTSLKMKSGATATDAVLYHQDDAASGPRLLVRDLSEQSAASQPPIILDTRLNGDGQTQLDYGFDNNTGIYSTVQSTRLLITRQNVASPKFKVLLFPHQSGETLPLTSWNADKTVASIDLRDGFTDRITFDSTRADKRTRVAAYTRTLTGRAAPTLNLPASPTVFASPGTLAFTGQPGAVVNFTVTATDDTGATLTPALSSPSGTVFPVGVNTIQATATDSRGQVTSRSFTVTVVPVPPTVTVLSATNQPGFSGAIALRWAAVGRATAYSVKRASAPGGPYTVVSDRQPASDLDFNESGLSGTSYYYVVTSWLDGLEGTPSAEIPLTPALDTLQAVAVGTELGASGVHGGGSRYLLTAKYGNSGNGSDSITYASMPWTGDGSFTVRVTSLTAVGANVSEFLNLGLSLRASTVGNAVSYLSGFTTYPNDSSFLQLSRATTGAGAVSSSYGIPPNPQRLRPTFWLRAVRSGSTFSAFFSLDGQSWSPTADPVTLASFPAAFLTGIGLGAQNDTVTDAVFDQFVFLGTPAATASGSTIVLNWQAFPGLAFTLSRATSAQGPFTPLATGLTATTFTDPGVTQGVTYFYQLTTTASEGGATTSPVVSILFPAPVVAPTNLTLTPAVGQITLNWTGSPPATTPAYTVQRATSPGGPFVTVASGLTATTYTDTGFNNGATYSYRVIAGNGRNTATSAVTSGASTTGVFTKANDTLALDTAAAWTPSAIPGANDTILWNGTYSTSNVPAATGLTVNALQLTSPSRSITLDSGTGPLVLGAGGLDMSAATQNLTINAPVTLAASQTWNIASGRTLTLGANLTESAAATALTKSGPGTLILAGADNTWTGPTTISGGTLQIGNNTPASFLPGATLASGATLRFQTTTSGTLASPVDGPGTLNNNAATALTLYQTAGTRAISTLNGASGATWILTGDPASTTTLSSTLNNSGLTAKFNSGNWILNGGGGYATTLEINGATVTRPAATGDFYSIRSFTIRSGQFTSANNYGFRLGSSSGAASTSAFNGAGLQDGGAVTITGNNFELGGNTPDTTCTYTINAGTFATANGIQVRLGAATTGAGATTLTLNGGKLLCSGNFQGIQAAPAVQVFAFNGGTFAPATYTATNLRNTPGGAPGTLAQTAGTLAPGDDGTAGKTAITGNYTLGGGTFSADLGGTTQATAFQTGQYDYLTISGATTLSGKLAVKLINNFTPSAATTFTVLNSTGTLTGAFTNVAFGQQILTAGSEGLFTVNKVGNTVTLTGYTPVTPIQAWRFQNFVTTANTGTAANDADPDADGLPDLLEYAIGANPNVPAPAALATTLNASQLTLTFPRARPDITYIVQGSDDLLTWTTLATNPGAVGATVTYTDPSATPRRFLRLKVTTP